MRLSPLDIRKQEFDTSLRGYDREDVQAFLQMVSEQWEEVLEDQRRLEEEVRNLKSKMEHYEQVEEALQEALQTARENAESKVENAERQAMLLIQEAEARAEEIKREAQERRDQYRREAGTLGERRDQVVARLRAFLGAELELLARFSGDEPADLLHTTPSEDDPQFQEETGPKWLEDVSRDLSQDFDAPPGPETDAPAENASTEDASVALEDFASEPARGDDAWTAGEEEEDFDIDRVFADAAGEEETASDTEETDSQAETSIDAEAHDAEAHDAEAHDAEAHDAEAHDAEAHDAEAHDAEASEPEASEPEASEPEASEPEASEPEASEPAPETSSAAEEAGAEKIGKEFASPSDRREGGEWDLEALLNSPAENASETPASENESGGSEAASEEGEGLPTEEGDVTATSEEIDKIRRILNDLE